MISFLSCAFLDINKIWYTNEPYLSLCFEKIVLGWIPCLFFCICFLFEWSDLQKRTFRNRKFSTYSKIKLIVTILIIYLIICGIALNFSLNENNILNLCWYLGLLMTYILLFGISTFQVTRNKPTSGISFLFAFFTVLCGWPQLITEIESLEPKSSRYTYFEAYLYVSMYILQIILFVLNCSTDSALTIEKNSPEEKASFISRCLMIWMYPYVWKNYWTKGQTLDDLWSVDYRTTLAYSLPIFCRHWKSNSIHTRESTAAEIKKPIPSASPKQHSKITKNVSITNILLKITRPFLESILIANLLAALFISMNNQVISSIITFAQFDEYIWHGYYLAILPLLYSIIDAFFSIAAYKAIDNLKLCLGTLLPVIIYQKALNLSMGAQKIYNDSEIMDLLTSTTYSIVNRTGVIFRFIMCLMTAIFCVSYIWQIIGLNTILLIVLFVGILTIMAILRGKSSRNFLMKNEITKNRLKLTQDVINGYKVLKLYAWELPFEKEILNHRLEEIQLLKQNEKFESTTASLFFSFSIMVLLCPILSILVFKNQKMLSIQEIFHLIGLINSLTVASINFPFIVQHFFVVKVDIGKIVDFLNTDEKENNLLTSSDKDYALSMENAFFSWTKKDNEEILRNINVKVETRGLVSVIGPMGSGKTSLLLAFLGEPHKIRGDVKVQGTVAYAPQQPWILNRTVKQNIIMNKPFDEKFYNLVIDACSLRQDTETFPQRDLSEIGEKGINLSGGQKQRISLARAVYSDADVYLLDDIFSALDLPVAGHIFHHLVGPKGLLHQKTRIIVTHNTQFLSQMDRIIMLNNQTVVKSDTYTNLKNTDQEFINLVNKLSNKDQKKDRGGKIDDMLKDRKDIWSPKISIETINNDNIDDINLKNTTIVKFSTETISYRINLPKSNTIEDAITRLTSPDTSMKKKGMLTVYRENCNRGDILLTLSILILLLSYHISRILTNLGLAYWSKKIDEIHFSNLTYAEIIITLVAISFVISYFYQAGIYRTTFNITCHVHDKLLTTVLKWPLILFEAIPSSQIINRFGLYLNILDNQTSYYVAILLMKKSQILFTYLFAIFLNPFYSIMILASSGYEYIVEKLVERRKVSLMEALSKQTAIVSAHTMETLNGLSSIRAMNLQQHFIHKFQDKIERRAILQHNYDQYEIWTLIQKRVCWILLTFVGVLAVIFQKQDSIEITGFVITYILTMMSDFAICDKLSGELDKSINALKRMSEFTDTPCENITLKNTVRSSWPENGNIVFRNLTVRYRQSGALILKNLNFRIISGEKVGVIGRTGAGKTSLISSIFRITEFVTGSIEIDNIDITSIALYDLRSKLTVIPQDPVLFSGTLRLNLDPLKEHSDEKLWDILEKAHLKSYVNKLPNRLDHVVETGGGNMSVGQKQLICLGRALLRKTKILILDEATASVDLNTDALIQSTIQSEFKHCTVLTIAHRIQTVFNYDKILVLDNGSIMEYDTPENLLLNENSVFYKLATIAQLT